jgi:hypothetical protein
MDAWFARYRSPVSSQALWNPTLRSRRATLGWGSQAVPLRGRAIFSPIGCHFDSHFPPY